MTVTKAVFVATSASLLAFGFSQLASCGSSPPKSDITLGDDAAAESGEGGDEVTSCEASQQICGGACVDTASDPMNCGGCGTACGKADLCCQGECVTGTCSFAVTGLSPMRGNQSGSDWVKLTGTGFVKSMQVYIGEGRAPVMVIDATHAIIQTPPGPVGKTDVILKNGATTSTTHAGFEYITAGVLPPWKRIDMPTLRGEHPGVAVLQDGRALIAGGTTIPDHPEASLASALVFTRMIDKGVVAPTANDMAVPRWRNSATTMLDGRVLVTGTADDPTKCTGATCKVADIFDPTTSKFTQSASPMNEDRSFVWSVLMVDGRVMITSGGSTTVELYDPATDKFSTTPLKVARQFGHRIVRLRDGRVMVLGGDGCSGTCGPAESAAELYDNATGAFTLAAPMKQGRSQFTAHVLPDGRVMVFGGSSSSAGGVTVPLDSIEAYDPKLNTWTTMTYKLTTGRTWHASALVRDGSILVMGGYNHDKTCDATNTVDQVDPIKGTVTAFEALTDANTEWNAVTLLDGSVVGVGGGACGSTKALPDIYFLAGAPVPK